MPRRRQARSSMEVEDMGRRGVGGLAPVGVSTGRADGPRWWEAGRGSPLAATIATRPTLSAREGPWRTRRQGCGQAMGRRCGQAMGRRCGGRRRDRLAAARKIFLPRVRSRVSPQAVK